MPTQTQVRPQLTDTVQQFGATQMAAVLAQQLQAFTAAGTLGGQKDVAVCDATAGTFIVTLPDGNSVMLGKEYVVAETSGVNPITVDAAGAGTINGAANLVVPAGEGATLIPVSVDATTLLVTWRVVGQTLTAGADPTAIHVNVAGEIHAVAAKALPVDADELVIENSAAAWAKQRITIQTLPVIHRAVAGEIAAIAAKAVPLDADLLLIEDSAAANAKASATILSLPVFHRAIAGEIAAVAAKPAPVAGDTILINDSAAANAIASATLGSLPAALASTVLQPAADAAVAILGSTGAVQLTVTGAGNVAITDGAGVYPGQTVHLFALAVGGGGSYTLALDVGTLTLNATSESAVVQRNAGNTAWVCVGLSGATIV